MSSHTVVDQTGESVTFHYPPASIVSLVPSQTELLYTLGLESSVAGITKFCVHPKHWLKTKKHVGGTKTFDFAEIEKIGPDLILGNKEENYEEGILRLKEKFPVWISDIVTLDDAFAMIHTVGEMTRTGENAINIIDIIKERFTELIPHHAIRTLYLIWRKPWMAAGKNTFIDHMLMLNGFENVITRDRYPELSQEEIIACKPDLVLLSSEPFPFRETHLDQIQKLLPNAKLLLVDGEMFSWYGSRLLYAPDYFNSLPL
jgi:ABC-type Fe3+-hydroxamate transport system substrate-binding protein